jgi:subfamily B ATP-binding cassette protein MsbA
VFNDKSAIIRSADELQVDYTTGEIVVRIWREHLRPRLGLLLIASLAMLLTAATTGAIPFLIQRTADDLFVAKNEQMVYWTTAAIVIVTVTKAIAEYVADVTVAYLGHRIVETGRHDELVAKGGLYTRLHAAPLAEEADQEAVVVAG